MQYNSNSTSQDIVSLANKKGRASNISYPLTEKTLDANEGSKIIWSWIHEAYGGWSFDDSNQTDFPEATTTITANQVDYSLPVDANFIKGVSYKDTGGVWNKLSPVTLEQIEDLGYSESQFYNVASSPRYYRLLANSVKIYPAASFTQAASLKIWEDREILLFTTTDTTKSPGWATAYHEALPTYMALQYVSINGTPQQIKKLQDEWDGSENQTGREGGYKKRIKSDYSRRFAEMFPARITVRDQVREYQ